MSAHSYVRSKINVLLRDDSPITDDEGAHSSTWYFLYLCSEWQLMCYPYIPSGWVPSPTKSVRFQKITDGVYPLKGVLEETEVVIPMYDILFSLIGGILWQINYSKSKISINGGWSDDGRRQEVRIIYIKCVFNPPLIQLTQYFRHYLVKLLYQKVLSIGWWMGQLKMVAGFCIWRGQAQVKNK